MKLFWEEYGGVFIQVILSGAVIAGFWNVFLKVLTEL